jgi:UDP-3-O-[3-hydroxymyristoyl] glucosamine N-acyltransferase
MISGSPAVDHEVWLKASAVYRRLPEMFAAYRKMKGLVEREKA